MVRLTHGQAVALRSWFEETTKPNGCSGWGKPFDDAMQAAKEVTEELRKVETVNLREAWHRFSRRDGVSDDELDLMIEQLRSVVEYANMRIDVFGLGLRQFLVSDLMELERMKQVRAQMKF